MSDRVCASSWWAGGCGHGCHQTVTKAVQPILSFHKPDDAHDERSDFWKNVSVVIGNILKDTSLRFNHGSSCMSDLIKKISSQILPQLNKILAVGSGNGLTEAYIGYEVLKAKIVHITDIQPPHDMVEDLSYHESIDKYSEADTLMFIYPFVGASEYKGVIRKFKGDYIVLIGELATFGHTNPDELLKQISEDFEELLKVEMGTCTAFCCAEHMFLYSRKLKDCNTMKNGPSS